MIEGHFDKDAKTVDLTAKGADLEDIEHLDRWLTRVRNWMRRQQLAKDGGARWTFEHTGPSAQWMRGKVLCGHRVLLRTIEIRKPRRCSCCGETAPSGSSMWRQREGEYGHSRERFCDLCVRRGGPNPRVEPPTLTVIRGGLEVQP